MSNPTNILKRLNSIINDTVDHLQDFKTSPQAFTRSRKLDALTLIKTTLNMQGNSLQTELLNAFPDLNQRMTVSAYEQQKAKLKPSCFRYIFDEFNRQVPGNKLLNHRYRLLAIDGSDFNLPWNPHSENVCDFSKNKPYCQMHVNVLYDLLNQTYQDCIIQPTAQLNERASALKMLHRLADQESIVLMDRGYDGFNMIENCNRLKNCHYLIRTRNHAGIKEIAQLPDQECDTSIACRVTTSNRYYITHKDTENIHLINHHWHQYKIHRSKYTKDRQWDFSVFCTVKFRVCKFKITSNKHTAWEVLLTDLNPQEFPLARLKKLYHLRWGVETAFRKLKYDLGSVQFHAKKDAFIYMELYAHLIMFNVVSATIAQVRVPQAKHCHRYAVDFKMACLIIHHYLKLTELYFGKLLVELGAYINPIRPGRADQRRLKPKCAISFVYRVA